MAVRTGQQFIEGLRVNPRDVWLKGEKISDVTRCPAFAGPIKQLAKLYDMQHDPRHADVLTYVETATGERAGTAFMRPKNIADLKKRRASFQLWAEATFGLMGRSPDFMNSTVMAFAEADELFARGGKQYADNIIKYYEHVRDNDLFLSHALITPQNDRSRTSSEQADEFLHLGVIKETDSGMIVRGARMLATLGPVADEILLYSPPGFKRGDERHAIVFAVPANAPGLRQVCRQPYTTTDASSYDHPLSTRFEECDSLLIFKDVFVPWERVFVYQDVQLSNDLYFGSNLRNHTAHQTSVRALVKLQFAIGLAISVARTIKADQFLHVQNMLGECLAYIEIVKSGIIHAEMECEASKHDSVRPFLPPLQTLRCMLPRYYPRVIEVLQTVGAGGLMMMPSGADFLQPEIAKDVQLHYQGAAGMPSVDRVRLFKLAWDLAGEAFGSRQVQYERYYAADPYRNLAVNYTVYDDRDLMRLVQQAVELAGSPTVASAGEKWLAQA